MADLVTELALGEIPTRADLDFGSRWPAAVLDAARRRGDPLGDDVVAELSARRPLREDTDLLAEVRALAEVEGGVFRELLESCCYVPAWADFAAMEPGLRLLATTGPLLSVSATRAVQGPLDDAGLDLTTTAPSGMGRDLLRRLADAGAMMFLLPLPGEVQPGGRHHAIVTRVRLRHAALRRRLVEDGHDVDRHGVPINQEDLAFAMAVFAHLDVRGLLRLGVRVTDEHIASIVLLWQWVGHVLGVEAPLTGTDAAGEVDRVRASLARLTLTGEASVAALGLLDGALEAVPRPLRRIARRSLDRTTAAFDGPARLDPHAPWSMRALRAAGATYGMLLHLPGAGAALHRLGTTLLESRYQDAEGKAPRVSTVAADEVAAGVVHFGPG